LPEDWGNGYEHVTICCTVENQDRADYRLPIYKAVPIKHKIIICEPIIGPIDLSAYLDSEIEQVVVGGESGYEARPCNYEWVLAIHDLCIKKNVSFWFKQTGNKFIKNDKQYTIPRKFQHIQARKAGINT